MLMLYGNNDHLVSLYGVSFFFRWGSIYFHRNLLEIEISFKNKIQVSFACLLKKAIKNQHTLPLIIMLYDSTENNA